MDTEKWLITGGCGFIGTNLIAYLRRAEKPCEVYVLDNLSSSTGDILREVAPIVPISIDDAVKSETYDYNKGIAFIEGDVLDFDACMNSVKGIDTIVHLAANTGVPLSVENPRNDLETNVVGTFNMLEAARMEGVKKFIFASSNAPLGEVEMPVHEKRAARPVSPYGASKLAGEAYCSAFYRTYGLNTVALRFSNVYGPYSDTKQSVIAKFIKQGLNKEPVEIYGDGAQTRDFIYVSDLVQAIAQAAEYEQGGELFHVATNQETTIKALATMLQSIMSERAGGSFAVTYGDTRNGDVKQNYSDITKAKTLLGFLPKVNLQQGLEHTVDYFFTKEKNKETCL